ncbi:NUDIX hydrolase [Pseudarcicella hirudinis]|uniref:NUDIX hydrolase n=1 Tax=Pseudarcicella hirudinis TaxID=1079859 RepID=UPI0035EF7BC9
MTGYMAVRWLFRVEEWKKEDENLIRTAMREAQEEIGIRLTDVRIIGELTELFIPPSNFFVQPVIGYLTSRPEFYPDAREVEDVIEVNLKELRNIDIIGREVMNVRGVDVDAPFYNIQNRKIWGATAMMIAELLELLQSEQF